MDALIPHLRELALALLGLWLLAELMGKGRRELPALILASLLVLLSWRGLQIEFFPLTNKYESFVTFTAALVGVGTLRYRDLGRPGRVLLALTGLAFLGTTLGFDDGLRYAPPLMITIWYPLHVPLSFAAYALWVAAAGDGLDLALGQVDRREFRQRQEANVRTGLLLFSLSMIFGGIWGVVSWGAYFLWDAKVVWSLATWIFYAAFAHVRYWPLPAGWVRIGLGWLGMLMMLITYVGTSFMTGSIHSF